MKAGRKGKQVGAREKQNERETGAMTEKEESKEICRRVRGLWERD